MFAAFTEGYECACAPGNTVGIVAEQGAETDFPPFFCRFGIIGKRSGSAVFRTQRFVPGVRTFFGAQRLPGLSESAAGIRWRGGQSISGGIQVDKRRVNRFALTIVYGGFFRHGHVQAGGNHFAFADQQSGVIDTGFVIDINGSIGECMKSGALIGWRGYGKCLLGEEGGLADE